MMVIGVDHDGDYHDDDDHNDDEKKVGSHHPDWPVSLKEDDPVTQFVSTNMDP